MVRPSEDDREAIDRAFAELMAGYHLTSDRPDPLAAERQQPKADTDPEPGLTSPIDTSWADAHPLFSFQPAETASKSSANRGDSEEADEVDPADDAFTPEEPAPLPKPAWPVLIAWLGLGYSILVMLAAVVGIRPPAWAGWLALIGFVGGIGLLFARLPRSRPPDAGDGAVL
ncbi:MAG: hypothetical protein QOF52_1777 [Propionibacteriaceae bacterium]|jgi:hypothetical protein|nr:hypothetical protein [Propionibacteriaceae bacterium]MDX6321919.1 hypothetical protein [Propionibacteriaceae bacterium]